MSNIVLLPVGKPVTVSSSFATSVELVQMLKSISEQMAATSQRACSSNLPIEIKQQVAHNVLCALVELQASAESIRSDLEAGMHTWAHVSGRE